MFKKIEQSKGYSEKQINNCAR